MNDLCIKLQGINTEIKEISDLRSELRLLREDGIHRNLFDGSFATKELQILDDKIVSLMNEKKSIVVNSFPDFDFNEAIDKIKEFNRINWRNDLLYSIYSLSRIENDNVDDMSNEDLLNLQNMAYDWSGEKFPLDKLVIVKAYSPEQETNKLFFTEFLLIPGFVLFFYGTTKADSCLAFRPFEDSFKVIKDVLSSYKQLS